jgi:hypothetical protein
VQLLVDDLRINSLNFLLSTSNYKFHAGYILRESLLQLTIFYLVGILYDFKKCSFSE